MLLPKYSVNIRQLMPLTKSAIKKAGQDLRKRVVNRKLKQDLKDTIKVFEEKPNPEILKKVYSKLDKAVKVGLIHKNTASRKKSSLAKQLGTKKITKAPKKVKSRQK